MSNPTISNSVLTCTQRSAHLQEASENHYLGNIHVHHLNHLLGLMDCKNSVSQRQKKNL